MPTSLRLPALLAALLSLALPLGLGACGGAGADAGGELAFAWPPVAGQPYPDLELRDFRGETVQLSSFRGKVLLIEPIGMT